jgi:hypothetical protein
MRRLTPDVLLRLKVLGRWRVGKAAKDVVGQASDDVLDTRRPGVAVKHGKIPTHVAEKLVLDKSNR